MPYESREQSKMENYQRNSTKNPSLYLIWQGFPCLKNQEIFDLYFKQMRISSLCGVCAFPKNLHTTKLGEIMLLYLVFGLLVLSLKIGIYPAVS